MEKSSGIWNFIIHGDLINPWSIKNLNRYKKQTNPNPEVLMSKLLKTANYAYNVSKNTVALDLYKEGKNIAHATLSELMKNGRKWQQKHEETRKNHLMPCSIRDHYKNFRENILTDNAKPEDIQAAEAIKDTMYFQSMVNYDEELTELTGNINEPEFADVLQKA